MANPNKFTSKEVLNKVLLDSSGNAVTANSVTTQEALNSVLDTTNNRLNMSLAGGTISGDVTIDGDLTVNGNGSGNYDEIINGTLDVSISGSLDNQEYTAMRLKYDDSTGAGDGSGVSLDWTWQDDATSETTIGKISTVRDTGDNYGAMKFYTANNGSVLERMRLTSAGKLGIGNAVDGNVDTPLHIRVEGGGNNVLTGGIKMEDPAISGTEHLGILFSGRTDNPGGKAYMGAVRADNFGVMDLVFYTDSAADDGSVTTSDNVMTFTHDGRLGIGTAGANVDELLHVQASSGNVYAKVETEASNSSAGLRLLGGNNDESRIHFGDSDVVDIGKIVYIHGSTNAMAFTTNTSEAMRITSDGSLAIGSSSASRKLHITDTSANVGIRLTTGTALDAIIDFGDSGTGGDGDIGQIRYDNNTDQMHFKTNTTDALTLGSDQSALFSGQIHLGSTNQFRIYSEGSGGSDNQVILAKLNNLTILNQHNGGNISFGTDTSGGTAVTNMILDSDSRISLSNNDASGAVGTTLFGYQAGLNTATGGVENTFIGHQVAGTGTMTSGADSNTGIGFKALAPLTSGTANTMVGYRSGNNINTGSQNTALGADTLKNCTDGTHNVAIGYSANFANAGDYNVAVGSGALVSNVGNRNVAVGYQALNATDNSGDGYNVGIGYKALTAANGTGIENVAIGGNAGLAMTTGHENVLIGSGAGASTTNSDDSILIGYHAGQGADITADGIIGIGYQALQVLTSGSGSTAIGYQAGKSINVGDQNTALGYKALTLNTVGEYNVAIGYETLETNVHGSFNTGVGRMALEMVAPNDPGGGGSVATHNTGIGASAGGDISTGTFNTSLGSNSGHDGTNNLTTGTQNTFLGAYTNGSGANAGNQTVIGYNADGTGDNEIALGNTSISAIKAQVTSITAYSSDERTKKDVADYDLKGVDFIKELKLKTYLYKNPVDFPDEIRHSKWDAKDEDGNLIHERPSDPTETQVGLIAQEVEAALAKHGVGNVETYAPTQDSGIKTLTYGNLIFPLIKAVQELSARVEELESK